MKKVFLITRTDNVDYDEYDSCVIVADNKEEVAHIIDTGELNSNKDEYLDYWDNGKRIIKEIDLNTIGSKIICSSYNAG
jgi:hypothetical protein